MKDRKLKSIRGSGGGDDSGGVRSPVVRPDSLSSIAFLKILDLICEGEIVGLVNGSKSVFLNGTVLQNDDDTYNFQNVEWTQRRGTQTQDYIADDTDSEREIAVGAGFKYGNPSTGPQPCNVVQSGTAIVRTIVDPEVDAVRIRISVPSLTYTDSIDGDVSGSTAIYSVWIKAADDADWVQVLYDVITGKSTSKYERSKRINLHGTSPWLIRVQRESLDAPNSFVQNAMTWESYTEITDAKLTYPNSALIGISIDASQFSSVPSRIYEMDLLKIRVPTNYNDVTRAYTGVWDGTWKISTGACSNPAWVFFDILTSERYGLGQFIQEDQINKWSLYKIARYCDELVPDGFGGMEPRFACNIFIPSATGAYELLKSLASIFRGMIYWANGAVVASQDAPSDPVYLYNQANVVDGNFTYAGASAGSRHSVAQVSWNDPSNFYQSTIEYVEDQDAIKDLGVVSTQITAMGCTSRGQAHRLGRWLLYTEKYEDETITFSTGLEALACMPGDLIQVSDPAKAGAVMGGRTSAATTTTLTVDRDIDHSLEGSLIALLPNGTVEEKPILQITGRLITINGSFSVAPQAQGAWIIKTEAIEPQLFRVVGITEVGDGTYSITCLKHYSAKYGFVEDDLILDIPSTSSLNEIPVSPQNLLVTEALYSTGSDVRTRATFSWDKVTLAANYQATYSFNGGNTVSLPLTQFNEVDISDVQPGNYIFGVVAINSLGKQSPPAYISYEIKGKTSPPQDVQNFSMIPSQGSASLSWDRATDLDVIIGGYVRIRWTPRTTGQRWSDGMDITPALTGNSTSLLTNLLAGTYMAKFVDSSGNFSVNEQSVVTNVADIYALNRVDTITEDPTFTGTMTRMAYVPSEQAITLTSEILLDDILDVDSLGSFDFLGDITGSGEYEFATALNLGGIWPYKVRVNVDLEAYDTGNYVDQRLDQVDDWQFWDGESINALDAQVYMRTTEDDPSGLSPTWSEWKKIVNSEYRTWGAQFKVVCTNDEPNHNLYIRHLGVVIDMDDRTWASSKLTSLSTGDLHVAFDPQFYGVPAIGVTEENASTGDYKAISNVTANGFDISFRNSAGARVVRDFYVLAKSYGIRLT